MSRIVLDTTAFHPWEWDLDPAVERLMRGGRDREVEVLVPEVVVREVVRHFERGAKRSSRELRAPWQKAAAFGALPPNAPSFARPDLARLVARYEQRLRQTISDAGRILDLPAIDDIARLLDRTLLETKPAGQEKDSFRDQLIWETIVEELRRDSTSDLVFVSTNHTDFYDRKSLKLHPDLVAELQDEEIAASTILIDPNPGSAADRMLPPSEEILERITAALTGPLADELLDRVRAAVAEREVDSISWSLESDIDEAFLGTVDEVFDPQVTQVYETAAGRVTVELVVQVRGDVEIVSFSPTGWDTDTLAGTSTVLNATSDAPIVQMTDPRQLEAEVVTVWALARGVWDEDVEVGWLQDPSAWI